MFDSVGAPPRTEFKPCLSGWRPTLGLYLLILFVGSGTPVSLLVRGESLWGTARAILDDPAYTQDTFKRLRPDAMEGFGTLVEIRLDATARSRVLR